MYLLSSEITTSVASSLGMIALAGYISSPTSSTMSFDSLPQMIGYSQTQPTQVMTEDDIEPLDLEINTLWIKRPWHQRYSLPKIK
jgi:hypothetical protein